MKESEQTETGKYLKWDRPMTSAQASKYLMTNGFIAVELYRADIARLQSALSAMEADRDRHEAVTEAVLKCETERKLYALGDFDAAPPRDEYEKAVELARKAAGEGELR